MDSVALLVVMVMHAGCSEHPNSISSAVTSDAAGCGSTSYLGCCSGQTLIYCAAGKAVVKACSPGKCGWSVTFSLYACGISDGGDPAGKVPRSCPTPDGSVSDLAPADQQAETSSDGAAPDAGGCGPVSFVGCCHGSNVVFCSAGTLLSKNCSADPACGWNPLKNYYDCKSTGKADPSGTYPMSCGGLIGDAGLFLDSGADQGADAVAGDMSIVPDAAAMDHFVGNDGFSTSETPGPGSEPSPLDGPGLETVGLDAASFDGHSLGEGPQVVPSGGGCTSCRVPGGGEAPGPADVFILLLTMLFLRRR